MAGFVLTPLAQSDVTEILAYLWEQSPQASRAVRKRLKQGMEKLGAFPELGHVRDSIAPPHVRFWPVPPYAIVYRADKLPIQIIRVLHMSRDLAAILREDGQ